MRKTVILFLAVMALVGSLSAQLKGVNGNWKSEKTEDLGNKTWATRDFTFDGKNWEILFTLYLDEAKTMPVFAFKGVGKYEITGKSATVKGASEATFGFDKKYITLLTDNADLIKNFGFTSYNLSKGVEVDITENGCSFLPSKKAYPQEFDLLQLKDGKLYLGARPADGNMSTADRRPNALGNALIIK